MFDNFEKLNFTNMDDVALSRWLRANSTEARLPSLRELSIYHALQVAKLVREAYRLGEIRGKALKN